MFRKLVLHPFLADIEAWASHGWCAPHAGLGSTLALLARQGGVRATLLHRVAHWATITNVRGLPMAIQALNLCLHGIELTPASPIGPGFYLAHTTGTVITAARIGARVECQGGVTIGQRHADGFPTIEDDVLLGAGCRVLGPITLGSGARIGANAVVLADVPAGCTSVGVPARVLQHAGSSEGIA